MFPFPSFCLDKYLPLCPRGCEQLTVPQAGVHVLECEVVLPAGVIVFRNIDKNIFSNFNGNIAIAGAASRKKKQEALQSKILQPNLEDFGEGQHHVSWDLIRSRGAFTASSYTYLLVVAPRC